MNIEYRIFRDKILKFIVFFLSFTAILPLVLILFQVIKNGILVINFKFFTQLPPSPGEGNGGIVNSIIGTAILIGIAVLLSVPIGIFVGIYLAEFKNRFSGFLRIIVNVLQGLPSIVIGIIAYIWVVKPMGGFSALSGGVALAIMMLPVVIKSTEETLRLIPFSIKEASYSLGVNYARTILKVIIPTGAGGIISGVIIGVSRIAGETAPLLFTAFGNPYISVNPVKPIDALPLLIFNYSMSPYENWHKIAWGASFVLIMFVFALNLMVKVAGERWKVKF